MSTEYVESFTEGAYSAVKLFMRPNPDMPETYNEWLYLTTKRVGESEANGTNVQRVEVNPNEFQRYCKSRGCDYDIVAIRNFVIWKGSGQDSDWAAD